MHRSSRLVAAALALLVSAPAFAHRDRRHRAHGDNFFFVEENDRLPQDPTEGTSTTDIDLVDVDLDGDLDLFITQGTAGPDPRANRLLINDGEGVYADESATRLRYTNVQNSAKTDFGDIDGDGDLDAIIANVLQEQLLVNDGAGNFDLAPRGRIPVIPIPRPGPPSDFDVTADAVFADVNCDGHLDILLSNENPFALGADQGRQNRLYLNNGMGWYLSNSPLPPAPGLGDQSIGMLVGDVDEDGAPDIIVLNRGQERVLMGDCSGAFVEETAARMPLIDTSDPNTSSSRGGALADLDRDGDLDLIVANSRGQAVDYYKNDGAGVFVPAEFGAPVLPDETNTGLLVVNLDRDRDLDVYLLNAGRFDAGPAGHGFFGGPDRYFRNGRGGFRDRTEDHFDMPIAPTTAAAFGDIDEDGDLDLVTGNTDDNVPGDTGAERVFVQRHRCPWWWGWWW
jgi:hypothetical protein